MIKIFNHYIHRRTLLQIILDFGLIIGIVVLAVGWRSPNLLLAASTALPSAALLGAGALSINAALGFYQRVHNRSIAQSRARGVLSLFMMLPLAYIILHVLPLGLDNRDFVALSVVAGLVVMLMMPRIWLPPMIISSLEKIGRKIPALSRFVRPQ